jgi:hypothetical protein
LLRNFALFDVTSVILVLLVIGLDVLLGAALNLKAAYLNAFKYDYQTLPYLCLLTGALISKSEIVLKAGESKARVHKAVFTIAGVTGLALFAVALYFSIHYFQMYSTWTYIIFKVEPNAIVGYNLFSTTPILENSPQMFMQTLGYVVALTGILWIGRHKIASFAATLSKKF